MQFSAPRSCTAAPMGGGRREAARRVGVLTPDAACVGNILMSPVVRLRPARTARVAGWFIPTLVVRRAGETHGESSKAARRSFSGRSRAEWSKIATAAIARDGRCRQYGATDHLQGHNTVYGSGACSTFAPHTRPAGRGARGRRQTPHVPRRHARRNSTRAPLARDQRITGALSWRRPP
jgi:hypothetical protein